MIKDRISALEAKITEVCRRAGRSPEDVTLIAVTKYATIDQMAEAVAAGIREIGENRVQDAREKFDALAARGVLARRHMIGHLQTNKVKQAIACFDMIQSVDSIGVAGEIDKQARLQARPMPVLIQVNISGEDQKSGVSPDGLEALVRDVSGLASLTIRGLMTIGPLTEDRTVIAGCFERMRQMFDRLKKDYAGHPSVAMDHLSMGMTQDYDLAIEHGATMVRIGSAIFSSTS